MSDITLVPVGPPVVSGIMCECGTCGSLLEFDHMDLSEENGMIENESMFGECPDCGSGYDASAVTFSAYLKEPSDV